MCIECGTLLLGSPLKRKSKFYSADGPHNKKVAMSFLFDVHKICLLKLFIQGFNKIGFEGEIKCSNMAFNNLIQ